MRKLKFFLLFPLCAIFSLQLIGQGDENPPKAEDLVRTIPIINLKEGKFNSGEIRGWFNLWANGSPIQFTVLFQKDKFLIRVEDSRDGAVFSLVTNEQTLVYDPVGGQMLLFPDGKAKGDFFLRQKKDALEFALGLGFENKEAKEKRSNQVEIDFPGILMGENVVTKEVVKKEDGVFLLREISKKGNSLEAWIHPRKKMPLTKMVMYSHEGPTPRAVMALTRVTLDQEIPEKEFSIPERKELGKVIPVRVLDGDNKLAALEGVALFLRAGYARLGINNPEVRQMIKYPGLVGINWETAGANDKKYAPLLKPLFQNSPSKPIVPVGF